MFAENITAYFDNYLYAAVPVLIVAMFVGALWHLLNRITPFDDHKELFDKNNFAYAVQRIALLAAQVIGMLHVLEYSIEKDGLNAVFWMVAEGAWVFVVLLAVRPVVDRIVLRRINNLQRLLDRDISTGIVEAGFYIGLGVLLNGSLDGSAPTVATGLASTVVFGLLGLAVVIAVFYLHEVFTPYNLQQHLEERKVTAAIEVAALLIAVSIVVRTGVAGVFTTWQAGFAGFFATVVFTVPTLYLFRWLIDRFVLTNCTVRSIQANNQVVAALVLGALLITVAVPIQLALNLHL